MSLLQGVEKCQRDEDKIRVLQAASGAAGPECPLILRTFQSGTPAKREAAKMLAQKCQGINAGDLHGVLREFDQSQPEEKLGVLQAFAPKLQDPQNKSHVTAAFFGPQDQQRADKIITSTARGGPPQGPSPQGPPPPGYPPQGYPPQGPPPPGYPPQGYPPQGYPPQGAPQPGYGPPPPGYGPPPPMMAGRPMVVGPVVQGPPMMVPGQPMGQPIMDYKMQKKMAKQQKKMYKKGHHGHHGHHGGFGSFSFSL